MMAVLVAACISSNTSVFGAVEDYTAVIEAAKNEEKTVQTFATDDGEGNSVQIAAHQDTLYVSAKSANIYSAPGETSEVLAEVVMGEEVGRTGVCDNGWSKVAVTQDDKKINGYIQNQVLSDEMQIDPVKDTVEVKTDSSVLNYPGRKDGEVIGEVLELDTVERTGTVDDVWSQIVYEDIDGQEETGYIPTSCLDLPQESESDGEGIDESVEAGTLHESSGDGVFAEANEDTGQTVTEQNGVQIGTAEAVSSDASLKSLGVFKITHYCPCSICCGPWADGITSTGVTATTNHTIAVDPSQIPYGTKVVINGQVYVAEDCGGAIKTNCIDIYVATHAEGEAKGVYYTEVYIIQ